MTDWSAMTTNERLVTAGVYDEWDKAARRRDRARMIELLTLAHANDPEGIADTTLANPEKYGF